MAWTQFMDMHSGGGTKEPPYEYIYIEAPEPEAVAIFYNRFDHNPHRVTCTCCGNDYSIRESPTLEEATAYERGCEGVYFVKGTDEEADYERKGFGSGVTYDPDRKAWVDRQGRETEHRYVERQNAGPLSMGRTYTPLDEYLTKRDVLVIGADEIKPEERSADVPDQGYVWVD